MSRPKSYINHSHANKLSRGAPPETVYELECVRIRRWKPYISRCVCVYDAHNRISAGVCAYTTPEAVYEPKCVRIRRTLAGACAYTTPNAVYEPGCVHSRVRVDFPGKLTDVVGPRRPAIRRGTSEGCRMAIRKHRWCALCKFTIGELLGLETAGALNLQRMWFYK